MTTVVMLLIVAGLTLTTAAVLAALWTLMAGDR